MTIRLKIKGSSIKNISQQQFYQWFRVRYKKKIIATEQLPEAFIKRSIAYSKKQERKFEQISEIKKKIPAGLIIPAYIAHISETVGYGLFAYQNIANGEIIGEYTGTLSRDWIKNSIKPNDFKPYLLKYPFNSPFAIDAQDEGNELRFINHSSKNANTNRLYIFNGDLLHILFAATRPITRHQQILIDYGEKYWKFNRPKLLR